MPVTWLVAANDSYFSPALSRQLADAFRGGGGKVDFHVLAASGSEGHWLAETESGVKIAAPELDRALKLPARSRQRETGKACEHVARMNAMQAARSNPERGMGSWIASSLRSSQ